MARITLEDTTPHPALLAALRTWLGLGLLALLLLPAARGHSLLIGWLPFWLVLAPLSALLAGERLRLAAAVSAWARRRRSRTRRRAPQARRISRRSPAACAPGAARTRP